MNKVMASKANRRNMLLAGLFSMLICVGSPVVALAQEALKNWVEDFPVSVSIADAYNRSVREEHRIYAGNYRALISNARAGLLSHDLAFATSLRYPDEDKGGNPEIFEVIKVKTIPPEEFEQTASTHFKNARARLVSLVEEFGSEPDTLVTGVLRPRMAYYLYRELQNRRNKSVVYFVEVPSQPNSPKYSEGSQVVGQVGYLASKKSRRRAKRQEPRHLLLDYHDSSGVRVKDLVSQIWRMALEDPSLDADKLLRKLEPENLPRPDAVFFISDPGVNYTAHIDKFPLPELGYGKIVVAFDFRESSRRLAPQHVAGASVCSYWVNQFFKAYEVESFAQQAIKTEIGRKWNVIDDRGCNARPTLLAFAKKLHAASSRAKVDIRPIVPAAVPGASTTAANRGPQ